MSLYIRLHTNFWTHRKTMRLKTLIGNDAFWIPQRLWSYAAENQPDGDFTAYQPEELCMLLGCSSNASSMLQALQQSGFMDGMKIHDWNEHNEYHHTFSERAKKAAKVRWNKEERIRKERKGKDQALLEHAPSIIESKIPYGFAEFWELYPKSQAKLTCLKIWKSFNFDRATADKVLASLRIQIQSKEWLKDGGKYIPKPENWLSGGCWEDKLTLNGSNKPWEKDVVNP